MQIASIPFLVYFLPVLLIVYYACSFSTSMQNGVLFFFCLLFYAWGDPQSVTLLIACVLLTSVTSYLMMRVGEKQRRHVLYLGICVNLFILFATRYMGSFLELLGPSLGIELHYSVHEPMGMLVFILHAISYLVDVYRGKANTDTPFNVGVYISFFPFLYNGPVLCYREFASQMRTRKIDYRLVALGVCRLIVGIAKLVILADRFAGIADNIFSLAQIDPGDYSVPVTLSWLGVGTFTLQIYFQLSGYSDMAIGIAMMLGFNVSENFNAPYSALSLRDFWRRWETGLVLWFSRYLNSLYNDEHSEKEANSVLQILTFSLIGFWHGTSYNFLLWGAFNGIVIMMESIVDYPNRIPTKFGKHLYTMLIVSVGFVLYRASDIYQASRYYLDMLCLNNNGVFSDIAVRMIRENWLYLIIGVLLCFPVARNTNEKLFHNPDSALNQVLTVLYPIGMIALFAISLCFIVTGSYFPT